MPARVLDHIRSFADQGGGQTGSVVRTNAGTIKAMKPTTSQFFNPGFGI